MVSVNGSRSVCSNAVAFCSVHSWTCEGIHGRLFGSWSAHGSSARLCFSGCRPWEHGRKPLGRLQTPLSRFGDVGTAFDSLHADFNCVYVILSTVAPRPRLPRPVTLVPTRGGTRAPPLSPAGDVGTCDTGHSSPRLRAARPHRARWAGLGRRPGAIPVSHQPRECSAADMTRAPGPHGSPPPPPTESGTKEDGGSKSPCQVLRHQQE